MSSPRLARRVRALALALLGVFGVLASPRPSLASGCHVDERPRFGLTILDAHRWVPLDEVQNSLGRWAPRPCSGDAPIGPDRTITPAAAMTAALVEVPPSLSVESLPPPGPIGILRTRWDDHSRPPR